MQMQRGTHLVFNPADGDAVNVLGRYTILINFLLWDQEERDATSASRGIGQTSKHAVDDVVGHVMLAARDEDLGAGYLVSAVVLWNGFGRDLRKIGAALRLGQAHGAGPFARHHLWHVL